MANSPRRSAGSPMTAAACAATSRRARESGARLEEERNRLAALMSELAEGVLVCNAEGGSCSTTSARGSSFPATRRCSAWAARSSA